jgi:hypothetical protein
MIPAILRAQWLSMRIFRMASSRGAVFQLRSWRCFGTASGPLLAVVAEATRGGSGTARANRKLAAGRPVGGIRLLAVGAHGFRTMGASLDLRKLLVYPVPRRSLFLVEILLRVTTCAELLLLLAGAGIGLLRNPAFGGWSSLGARASRHGSFRRIQPDAGGRPAQPDRAAAEPQGHPRGAGAAADAGRRPAAIADGHRRRQPADRARISPRPRIRSGLGAPRRIACLAPCRSAARGRGHAWLSWTVAAYLFGRWQFNRSLRYDFQAAQATVASAKDRPWADSGCTACPRWCCPIRCAPLWKRNSARWCARRASGWSS